MLIGDNVFAEVPFATPLTEEFERFTWNEICKNENEWESIEVDEATIKRCD